MTIKLWYILKYLVVSSYFYSPRAQRLANTYKVNADFKFAVKCLVKFFPLPTLFVMYSSNLFIGAYLVRIWERLNVYQQNEELDNYSNCCWYIVNTISVIGYGDYVAKTFIGRLISCLILIIGVLENSILIVVLTNLFNFQGGQLKAFNMLNHIELKENLNLLTKKIFINSFRLFHNNILLSGKKKFIGDSKKYQNVENLRSKLLLEKEQLIQNYKEIKKKIKDINTIDSVELIIDKLTDVRKSFMNLCIILRSYEKVVENEKENQRNLEALKNSVSLDD